ncbi:MAG: fumarylacetoacetate hydrolase family protein [Proteobacteria bacterium]|nr:fumarylacetoacetate hydrolase family protein [Pseudomonadota bacterium]
MRLVTYSGNGATRVGVLGEAQTSVTPQVSVTPMSALDPSLPDTMLGIIRAGARALARARDALAQGGAAGIPLEEIKILAPIPRPGRNILCVGRNYRAHAAEFQRSGVDATATRDEVPDFPIIFTKAPSAVIGPGEPIRASLDPTATTDNEGELGVVIGKGGRGINRGDAWDTVFGYTIINDVTARTLQTRHRQWFIGKSLDSFCPMGPCIAVADQIDVTRAKLVTRVNGEVRQEGLIADLIFDIPTLVETLSATMTLETGDVIATGTPAGVGIGFDPPKYLAPGDVVSIRIEGIGELTNPVE